MALAACSTSDSADSSDTTATTVAETAAVTETTAATETTAGTQPPSTTVPTETTEAPEPDIENAGCDWDSGRLSSDGAGGEPTSEGSDLPQAILGSWQHTHIDTGAGFEPIGPDVDIRYVLSADRFLYCQDVEGATDKSENSAPLKLEGAEIILPSPATGYAVTAWNDDTMVWLNHRDGSFYLLRRR